MSLPGFSVVVCFLSQPGKKASSGIFQGEMVACYVFLHTVQTVKCADNAENDWTDVIPKSNGNKKKCTALGVAVFQA